jgi:hypothetical protein
MVRWLGLNKGAVHRFVPVLFLMLGHFVPSPTHFMPFLVPFGSFLASDSRATGSALSNARNRPLSACIWHWLGHHRSSLARPTSFLFLGSAQIPI